MHSFYHCVGFLIFAVVCTERTAVAFVTIPVGVIIGNPLGARPKPASSSVALAEEEPPPPPPAALSTSERIARVTQKPDSVVIIDAENVRGKTAFELDHADLIDRLSIWTKKRGSIGRTIVVVDHGSSPTGHELYTYNSTSADGGTGEEDAALGVVFAGMHRKADDVIAGDISTFRRKWGARHFLVVTGDRELAWRCRCVAGFVGRSGSFGGDRRSSVRMKGRARSKRQKALREAFIDEEDCVDETEDKGLNDDEGNDISVEIISPQNFLEDMDEVMLEWVGEHSAGVAIEADTRLAKDKNIASFNSNDTAYVAMPSLVANLQKEFRIWGEILTIESKLRGRCNLHKQQSLTGELRRLKSELDDIVQYSPRLKILRSEEEWTSLQQSSEDVEHPLWGTMSPEDRDALLMSWGKRSKNEGTRREKTQDRIVLAERLRRQLELGIGSPDAHNGEEKSRYDSEVTSYVKSYVNYINAML